MTAHSAVICIKISCGDKLVVVDFEMCLHVVKAEEKLHLYQPRIFILSFRASSEWQLAGPEGPHARGRRRLLC